MSAIRRSSSELLHLVDWYAGQALPGPSTRGVRAFWVRGLGRYFTVTTLPGGRGAIVRPRIFRTAAEVRDDELRPPLRGGEGGCPPRRS